MVFGHIFESVVLQALLCKPGPNGPIFVDGPRHQATGEIMLPHGLDPPAPPNLSIYRSRDARGSFSPQAGYPTHNTIVDRPGLDHNVSQDRIFPQPLPDTSIPMHDSFDRIDEPAPHMSSYVTNMDIYQRRLGHISPSVGNASESSDSSRTLINTPELPSLSRTSSVSAIPDAYLPIRSSSYENFHTVPSSLNPNHNSSISSTSSIYTPSSSRNQSGSSHTLQGSASDEAWKVIIRNIRAGVTHEELSKLVDAKLMEKKMRYVQHGRPKQGEDNKWSVRFFREKDAETVRAILNNFDFKGKKLKVHISNGGSGANIYSGGSTTSATSSTITSGPTIVDGSVTG